MKQWVLENSVYCNSASSSAAGECAVSNPVMYMADADIVSHLPRCAGSCLYIPGTISDYHQKETEAPGGELAGPGEQVAEAGFKPRSLDLSLLLLRCRLHSCAPEVFGIGAGREKSQRIMTVISIYSFISAANLY